MQEINPVKVVKRVLTVLVVLLIILGSFGTVKAGQVGVKTRFNAVTGKVIEPGLYFKLPFIEKVQKMDVMTQKEQTDATAASKDLQNVSASVALNYSLDQTQIVRLYTTLGQSYKERVIDPYIQESVKATTAKFTAEELITKREIVSEDIKNHLAERLTPLGIHTEGFSIVNFNFSPSFNQAIEAKVTAEQDALAAKNKLEQIKYEKEQTIVSAQGRAEALRIESQAINSNPQVLQLRAIEKWNGIMPQVTGQTMPLINLR
jgi:regulator of protease activity HflC (stomatin/prohibitin superfamily)